MIIRGNKELVSRFLGRRAVLAVYKGTRLVWEAVRSCFGAGFWKNDKPWIDHEPWRNE